MNGSYLLSGKFISAKLPDNCAPRYSLMERFREEANKRVIYVSAPAGCGKTTSTQLWLENSGRVPLWITLDEYDDTPAIFYKLFCTGIMSFQPENKAMADILASPSFTFSPVEHTIQLLSEFVPDDRQYAIVLDDMHLLSSKEIRKSGLFVEKRLPSSFIVIILTRNAVAEKYIEISGAERCAIITSRDMAFSAEEIRQYYKKCGYVITGEDAMSIYAVTNGWPIGVNAMAMTGQTGLEKERSHIFGDYIKVNIWDKWDAGLREFMLKTSLVDEMPADLCRILTGRDDSHAILERLCTDNTFITRLSGDLYKYHRLFSEFLRSLASELNIDTGEIYRKAAKYYMDHGEYFMARRYATKCGDMKTLIEVIQRFSQYGSACLDEFVSYSKLYANETPPESICDRAPFLYATKMWEQYLLGNVESMEYYLDKVYGFMPLIATEFPQYMETVVMMLTLDHRTPLSVQLDQFTMLPHIEYWHDVQQGATLTHEMPFLHRSNRDYYELADPMVVEKIRTYCGPLFKGSIDIFLSGIEAGLLLERNRINEALSTALRTVKMESENASCELRFSIFMHLADAYCVAGDPKFKEILAKAEEFIQTSGAQYLTPNFEAYKTKILLLNADQQAAQKWFDNFFVTDIDDLELYKIFQHFTTARAYIVLAEADKAMDYILKLKKLSADFNRLTDVAEAGVLQAVLEWALGHRKEALLTLESALVLMQEYGFIRVFANEGASVLPILKKLKQNVDSEAYSGPLDAHFLNEVAIAAYGQSRRNKGVTANISGARPIKLSRMQKQVLALLSKGYKNAEIAEHTGLSIHTVKSHCAAAYTKLESHNVMDAVLKAKELNLIE